jgi:hypothetical protein
MFGGRYVQNVDVWGRVNGIFGEREVVCVALSAT